MAGDITAVVTYDLSRLYMLEGLCLLWGGPLAAAVYVVRPGINGYSTCSKGHPTVASPDYHLDLPAEQVLIKWPMMMLSSSGRATCGDSTAVHHARLCRDYAGC